MVRVKRLDQRRRCAHPVGKRRLRHAVACKGPRLIADLPREDRRIFRIRLACNCICAGYDVLYMIVVEFLGLLVLHETADMIHIVLISVDARKQRPAVAGPLEILAVSA